MAAAGPSPLKCSTCATLYDDGDHQPKLLTCHHTLCLSCIVHLAKRNSVRCPKKCKLLTTLPNLTPRERKNVTTEKDFITKQAKKLQNNFYIKTIKENEKIQQLAASQKQTKLCSEHDETLTVWCRTCQRVICVKCQFTSHKGHGHDLLETSENASKTKQQYMTDIDTQFEHIHNDLASMLENKKQAIKNQVNLAVDVNIQLVSLDSLTCVNKQAANSEDKLIKVHVPSSSKDNTQRNHLRNQSLAIDDPIMTQIQQHCDQIKQQIQNALVSVGTPTMFDQHVRTDLKANSESSGTVPPTLSHNQAHNDTSTHFSRASKAPDGHHPITNRPVAKIGSRGSGPGQFNHPDYVAVDSTGMMYVSDRDNYRIHKMNNGGDYVAHWETDGFKPGPLAVNHELTELICAQQRGGEIIIYSFEGNVKKEFTITDDSSIREVAVNSRNQIVCCRSNCTISIVTRDGDILHRFGSGRQFKCPYGVCIGPDDDILVVDNGSRCVQILDHQGQLKHQFGACGNGNGQFQRPGYITVDQHHQILVGDFSRKDIQVFSYTGEFIRCIDSKDDNMSFPWGLAVTQDHHVLVSDYRSDCIFKFKYM